MNKGANGYWQYAAIINMPGQLAGIAALGIKADHDSLNRIDFLDVRKHPIPHNNNKFFLDNGIDGAQAYTRTVADQLARYFENPGWKFSLNIKTHGTAFQQQVWRELAKINYKKRCTYGELAKSLSTSPRAIGGACRSNPVPVVVPCHRVVSKSGPGGFCGTDDANSFELQVKNWLLDHEISDGVWN